MPDNSLLIRRDAAQKTVDEFSAKPFELGARDCAKLINFHLKLVGNPVPVAKCGAYSTVLGAKRGLKRLGFNSLAELMDAHFPRIAPAAALIGDVFELEGSQDDPIGALALYLGNGLTFGYHENAEGAVMARLLQPPIAAWRVL